MRSALLALSMLFCACAAALPGNCPDCCPPGDRGSTTVTVACRALRADGGAAAGISARCSGTDAGAITDATGSFSFPVQEVSCGIATGAIDCGEVGFREASGEALNVSQPPGSSEAATVSSRRLTSSGCTLAVH
ncbi:MAG: hypothetical protein IPJ65_40755 [Archangiaceae bacterium]|nr:hypothetical protein [Archangiaceae bacterium]